MAEFWGGDHPRPFLESPASKFFLSAIQWPFAILVFPVGNNPRGDISEPPPRASQSADFSECDGTDFVRPSGRHG